ncbi:uncharacterized protein ACHE_30371A [Aspergillus chevalieri]|uniref:Uncharacterized protein n=1 Tax=Aspergillus chevalieri TaxID=182096 RepID=A0A7R7VKM4_ASPCH|nr:uncharacterized protein ACHE_30371A [Aspergillus chevalieri]BCR86384.1 hypothetical protein ACHE_30371A [Aspergillus chevalieri]
MEETDDYEMSNVDNRGEGKDTIPNKISGPIALNENKTCKATEKKEKKIERNRALMPASIAKILTFDLANFLTPVGSSISLKLLSFNVYLIGIPQLI